MTPVSTPGPAAPFNPPFNPMSKHLISPQRIEANRHNAQKSTGPRTEEGKKNSRLNASRHYLTGQVRILPDEERKAVEGLCRPIIDRLAPVGEEEAQLARAIAEAHWRLARARAVEDNLFAIHIGTRKDSDIAGDNFQIADAFHIASAFAEQTPVFDRLTLYEQRIHRGRDRDEKKLLSPQRVRLAAEAKRSKKPSSSSCSRANKRKNLTSKAKPRRTVGSVFRLTVSRPPSPAIAASKGRVTP